MRPINKRAYENMPCVFNQDEMCTCTRLFWGEGGGGERFFWRLMFSLTDVILFFSDINPNVHLFMILFYVSQFYVKGD